MISLCQNICNKGILPGKRGIGSSTKEPSSLSNKLVQWVSTEEELKSPLGERISRYCSLNPRDLAGNVQLSQSLLILFVALPLMCECLSQSRSLFLPPRITLSFCCFQLTPPFPVPRLLKTLCWKKNNNSTNIGESIDLSVTASHHHATLFFFFIFLFVFFVPQGKFH